MLPTLWRLTRGYRLCPWRSPYLRWRIETYCGLHADRITFALGLPGWNVETSCAIGLTARASGTLLEIEHGGVGEVPVEESARARLRAAIVQTWIAALERARAAVLPAASG